MKVAFGSISAPPAVVNSASKYNVVANVASGVIKASAGTLYGFSGYNAKTTAQFIQIFDSATVPSDTAIPIITLPVAPQSAFSWDSGKFGMPFTNGISWSNSSTQQTKTIGTTDCWMIALYD